MFQGKQDLAGVALSYERLAAPGILKGRTASTYDPAGPVSRHEMATFLIRAYEYATGTEAPDGEVTFTDLSGGHEVSSRKLVGLGVTLGVTATEYAPGVVVERGQMASFLSRMLIRLAVEGHVGLTGAGLDVQDTGATPTAAAVGFSVAQAPRGGSCPGGVLACLRKGAAWR